MVVDFKGKVIVNEYGNKKEIVSKVLSILLDNSQKYCIFVTDIKFKI